MKTLKFFLLFTVFSLQVFAQDKKAKAPKDDYVVTISTQFGDMVILLFDDTPKHKENFIKLVNEGFYNGTTFHRIIDNFMIQGGDPNSKDQDKFNDGMGGPGYTLPSEILPNHKHVRGSVAAARMGDQVNPNRESNGSQFYIVENHDGTAFLDNAYTVFGQVIQGLDVIDTIAVQQKDNRDRPVTDIKMIVKVEKLSRKKIIKKYGCEAFYNKL